MGSSEIWDKYHECCIGNGENFTRHSRVKLPISNTTIVVRIYPKFSLLSHMLFHVNTILADFCWCFHVHDVQTALLKHMSG